LELLWKSAHFGRFKLREKVVFPQRYPQNIYSSAEIKSKKLR
jgi:hypothetical protein